MTLTLLIDSDPLIYKAAHGAQTNLDWGDGVSAHLDESQAMITLTQMVEDLITTLKADKVIMALGDLNGANWRKQVLPTYKAHRKPESKPKLLKYLRDFVLSVKSWHTYSRPTLEADDVLGILATAPDLVRGNKVIVSIDKDFQSVPCRLYNPGKPQQGIRTITVDQADYYHAYQTLIGDATDGYKGCPRIGPKNALSILGAIPKDEYWPAIVRTFEAKGLTEADALVQARVARICRDHDYDRKAKSVILWNPPKPLTSEVVIHNAEGEVA